MQNIICKSCQSLFSLTEADLAFYQKIDVPCPQLCPKDRLRRRLAFRNERTLFKRVSSKSGKSIISNMRPDAPMPVFSVEEWFKDDWEFPYLEKFDFNRPFFEQFALLSKVAPLMHKASGGNEENSAYTNHSGNCKNCYFIFNSEYDQECLYLRFADHCRDCVDCSNIIQSELCYECVNVENCYNLKFSDDCKNCLESFFLRNCRGVKNSIFCYGLDQKQYHIFNQAYSEDEYHAELKKLRLHTYIGLQGAVKKWEDWSSQFPKIREILVNCENCSGNSLYNCKNALDCYNCTEIQDSRYVLNAVRVKDSYDIYAYGEIELGYEYVTAFKSYNVKFCSHVISCDNMEYCESCYNCHYCFGCVGLRGKSFCVFNKQYAKQEYEDLVPRIKNKMKEEQKYGEFFPIELSPFPYEDTLANEYFPEKVKNSAQTDEGEDVSALPDDIAFIDLTAIEKKVFLCAITQKQFRFQKKELEFYKRMNLPLPHICFEARYQQRNKLIPFPF